MKEKTASYYWEKAAILHFSDLTLEEKWEIVERVFGKDEIEHLKQLLED